jgi:Glycosyltransferase family 87
VNARLAFAGAALALTAAAFALKASEKMPDFEVYWRAGARALANESLYREEDGHYQFKYLPAFAILAIPAALLPLTVAKAVWFTISTGLVAPLLALGLALLPSRQRPTVVVIGVTLVAMAKFYGHELVLGQVNLLFGTIVLLSVHLLVRGRSNSAGLLMALAVVIKPYAVIFMPWLAAQRATRALIAAMTGIVATLLLPTAVYGVQGAIALHADWWHTVTASTAPNLLNADNVSLAGMYAKWFGPGGTAARLTVATSLALLGAAAIVVGMRRRLAAPAGLEVALLLTLVPLLSPQGWDYVFLLSTPALIYFVNYERQLPKAIRALTWVALALVAFSLYDVIGARAYAGFMALSVITVCFLVVVTALATTRVRQIA